MSRKISLMIGSSEFFLTTEEWMLLAKLIDKGSVSITTSNRDIRTLPEPFITFIKFDFIEERPGITYDCLVGPEVTFTAYPTAKFKALFPDRFPEDTIKDEQQEQIDELLRRVEELEKRQPFVFPAPTAPVEPPGPYRPWTSPSPVIWKVGDATYSYSTKGTGLVFYNDSDII